MNSELALISSQILNNYNFKIRGSMLTQTTQTIVIDNGTGIIKGGLSGDEAPRSIFPNLVGKPKNEAIVVGGDNRECYIGNSVNEKKGVLSVSCPIEHGIITDWQDMIKVWHYAFFSELLVECAEQPILITKTPNSPEEADFKITEIMFEYFNAPAIFFTPTNVLSLFATGRKSGLVIDSGHDVTNVLPVFEGYPIQENIETELYGGKAITDSLRLIYEDRDPLVKGNFDQIQYLKEKFSSVPEKGSNGFKGTASNEIFALPDGQKVKLGEELQRIPDQMFNPVEDGFCTRSVQEMVCSSINKCDEVLHNELYQNILITGGNSLTTGYTNRLQSELSKSTNNQSSVDVRKERLYLTWIGASLLSSLSTFHELCIHRDDYNRYGADVVKRKCLL